MMRSSGGRSRSRSQTSARSARVRSAKPPATSATSSPPSGPWRSASSASARCTGPGGSSVRSQSATSGSGSGLRKSSASIWRASSVSRRPPGIAMSPNGSAWTSVTSPRRASSSVAISVTASSSGPAPAMRASKLTERARASAACRRAEGLGHAHAPAGEVRQRGRRRGGEQGAASPRAGARDASPRHRRRGGALEGHAPVARAGGVAPALGQPARRALEGRVGDQAGRQALAGLEGVGVGLLVDRLAQQAPRLQLGHGGQQDDQLAGGLGVPALARALPQRGRHDLDAAAARAGRPPPAAPA